MGEKLFFLSLIFTDGRSSYSTLFYDYFARFIVILFVRDFDLSVVCALLLIITLTCLKVARAVYRQLPGSNIIKKGDVRKLT